MEDCTVDPPVTVVDAETCSVASELTGDDGFSTDFVEQEESSVMESQKNESSEWTDEKHSLYLKSMEASFVDQLYNYSNVRSWEKDCSSNLMSSRKIHASTQVPSGQYKVLQHGCWSKINFTRENSELKESDRPHVPTGNPWIQHFRTGSKHGAVASPSFQGKPSSTAASQQFPVIEPELCCQESGGSNTEATDQNFVEEDTGRKKASRKRMRTSVVSNSSNDQVVPFGAFTVTNVADSFVSPKN